MQLPISPPIMKSWTDGSPYSRWFCGRESGADARSVLPLCHVSTDPSYGAQNFTWPHARARRTKGQLLLVAVTLWLS
jgi:hypothetical protein